MTQSLTVIVYSKTACVACTATKKSLKQKNIPYVEYFLDKDPEKLEEVKKKGHQTAPVVEVYNGTELVKSWAGFIPDEINKL